MYTPKFIKRENQFTKGGEYMETRSPVILGESKGYIGYYNITSEGAYTNRKFSDLSKTNFNSSILISLE